MRRRTAVLLIVAAFLAGGGGALAASRFVITNIHQIAPSVLKQLRGDRGARGPRGYAGPRGVAGPRGAAGAAGPAGATGATGSVSSLQEVFSPAETVNSTTQSAAAVAVCPPGDFAIGGGFYDIIGDMTTGTSQEYQNGSQYGWRVVAGLNSVGVQNGEQYSFQAIALCAPL